MTSEAKTESVPQKIDLEKLPRALECQNCGLTYCDCEVCDGSGTVQVSPLETVPEKAE